MLDIAQFEQFCGRDIQRFGEGRQPVTHFVDDDLVFVAVFLAAQQRLAQSAVFGFVRAAPDAAGQGHGRELRAAHTGQQFGRRAVEGEARARLEEEAVALGIMRRQVLQDRQELWTLGEAQFSGTGQDDLVQLAGADAVGGGLDHAPPNGVLHGVVDATQFALSLGGGGRLGASQLGQLLAQRRLQIGDKGGG